jgi:transposase
MLGGPSLLLASSVSVMGINEMVRRRVDYNSAVHTRRIIVMHIASVGIDLGKTTFHLVALGERSKVLVRKKFSRTQLLAYTANLPSALIGLEACSGAHFLGTALRKQGHQVRLMPAQFVKPYRKSNKNDFIDGEAIAEAVTKQNMRFVPIKTEEQLDVQAMHRVRDRLVQRRTALINEIRGFLLERGMTFPTQPIHLRKNLPAVIEDAEQNLSPRLRWLLNQLWQEWKQTEIDIETVTNEIERIGAEDERCRRLRQIPGFGPLVSTAMVAAIGNGAAFRRGRDFAAWVGVVPRQYSTGGKQKLFGISKRGNVYLRRMLIHGARAVLFRIKYDTAGLGQWVHRLSQRAPRNKVIVAIANKLARIAWAVLSSGRDYRHQPLPCAAA